MHPLVEFDSPEKQDVTLFPFEFCHRGVAGCDCLVDKRRKRHEMDCVGREMVAQVGLLAHTVGYRPFHLLHEPVGRRGKKQMVVDALEQRFADGFVGYCVVNGVKNRDAPLQPRQEAAEPGVDSYRIDQFNLFLLDYAVDGSDERQRIDYEGAPRDGIAGHLDYCNFVAGETGEIRRFARLFQHSDNVAIVGE